MADGCRGRFRWRCYRCFAFRAGLSVRTFLPRARNRRSIGRIGLASATLNVVSPTYTPIMSSTMNPDDLRANYIRAMTQPLGEVFHHLMQEMARLHLKWNELLTLFGQEKGRVDMLNRAAPGFFHLVQDSWWDDLLLGVSRITDGRTDVLTVMRLPKLVAVAIRAVVTSHTDTVVAATGFARDHRNRMIAHRNIDLVLGRPCTPLTPHGKTQMDGAFKALDDLLYLIDNHYTGTGPTAYEHLDMLGGAASILDIVKRGMEHRDAQFESYRAEL